MTTKAWTEMTEMERFIDALEGTLLAHADAKDVAVVIERLQKAVALERQAAAAEVREEWIKDIRADETDR